MKQHWHDLIQDYLAGNAGSEGTKALDEALLGNPDLRRLYLSYAALDVALENRAEADAALVRSSFTGKSPRHRVSERSGWRTVIPAVACIFIFSLLGLGVAAMATAQRNTHESTAKILVRYVIERSPEASVALPPVLESDPIEGVVEFLSSYDLAMAVVEHIGAQRILPGGSASDAAALVSRSFSVKKIAKNSNVINLRYRSRDPELATETLRVLLETYFDKVVEIHQSWRAEVFELVAKQMQAVRNRLRETEKGLQQMQEDPGATKEQIETLERKRAVEAKVLSELNKNFEKARLDLGLGLPRMQNITVVEEPGPARKLSIWKQSRGLVVGCVSAGLLAGILVAWLLEVRRRNRTKSSVQGEPASSI